MAANGARRTLQFSSTSAKALLTRSPPPPTTKTISSLFASKAASLSGLFPKPSSCNRLSLHKLNFSRLPVELGGALSLIPLHSVTASALFTSLLSLHNDTWGCLSEGFATPL
ncbi:hypothetical protein P3X46_017746 [Hevea brasiliensis]|uniref:Protein NUCLEAR FUSION DEFECTIVE 6, chloroplastic/mitochondrial-like n=1 Tax=Hevea brasiliensis TaxID=3981 RepID=A0ABQ9LRS4_HEVBR|nr:uncharacterized protein LOC110638849 [Hevea brasiliensis]KAJ9169570.1 hypothetical protein P3X46_017746 [Hevea brasiliensis]